MRGVLFLLIAFLMTPVGAEPLPPLTTVASLDLDRYLGTWYEIARYPNRFQRQCVRNTRAEYQRDAVGDLVVTNRCTTPTGAEESAVGHGERRDASVPGRLKVRFAPGWLSFLPSVWGDYWVVALDASYRWVVVSEPRRKYLWILARTSHLEPAIEADIRRRLSELHFDLTRLEASPHDP